MEKLKILNLNFSFQRAAHYHINGGMLLMGVVLPFSAEVMAT